MDFYFTKKDIEKLKETKDERLKSFVTDVLKLAEKALEIEVLKEENVSTDSGRSGNIHENYYDASMPFHKNIVYLAFAYMYTEIEEYFEKAKALMITYAGYKKWHGKGYHGKSELNTMFFCVGMAIGYHFFKDKLTDDERKIIVPIPVDYKEKNSVIFETQFKGVEPLFNGEKKFFINVPSFEEHIAEKLYIIAHCRREDIQNTRVKDFYDIYELHGQKYDGDKFSLYFQMMLLMYGEDIYNITTNFLNREFIKRHEELWEKMKEKYEFADKELELGEAVYYTRAVLSEQIQKISSRQFTEQAERLVREKIKR